MDTYRSLADIPLVADSVVTFGTFDGLHKGHLAVISRLVNRAAENGIPSAVLTFDPHPQHVLAPAGTPKKELIVSLSKKLALLEQGGVDLAVVLTFDEAFSRITAEDFLGGIVMAHFHPSHIVVGYDQNFGHQRRGTASLLKEQAASHHYRLTVVAQVDIGGRTVSSSSIRRFLHEGRCEEAEIMLGRPYEIAGRITAGETRGRILDYPTANLEPLEPLQLIPKGGVYVVSTDLEGQHVYGMCNVGFKPTFNGNTLTVEAHFFDPPVQDLYGRELAFRFHHWLRDEHKFRDKDELRAQIDRDKEESLTWIAELHGGNPVYASIP